MSYLLDTNSWVDHLRRKMRWQTSGDAIDDYLAALREQFREAEVREVEVGE